MTRRHGFIALALLLSPALAQAHPGHLDSGLLAGLSHPLGGLDHLLAMLAVGLWAAQQQGRARWLLPLGFLASLLLGGLLGFAGLRLPLLEPAISASLLALGLLVSTALRLPLALAVALSGLLAFSHGLAHGLELPLLASPWSYAAGFVAASAALHAAGFQLVQRVPAVARPLVRLSGVLTAGAGAWLLAS